MKDETIIEAVKRLTREMAVDSTEMLAYLLRCLVPTHAMFGGYWANKMPSDTKADADVFGEIKALLLGPDTPRSVLALLALVVRRRVEQEKLDVESLRKYDPEGRLQEWEQRIVVGSALHTILQDRMNAAERSGIETLLKTEGRRPDN